ncbi:MAG: Gfo/Idh/MocA family oxidoreductase [Candidatus Daviesbacteria bacterium]|nr:Gfo/Idh/MocA family oxidoreductase [Candidatus Daviesbacteria bacterium]
MKILFIGLGSIGRRHAKILQKIYKHDLYAFRSGLSKKKNELGIKEIKTWKDIENLKPDIAFITNPTSLHIETASKCVKLGCKLFIEKPISKDLKGLDLLIKLVKKKKIVTYVGYNLRFHPVIKELKKYTAKQKPIYARAVCTSFLPNWRPGTDFKKNYSANSAMGGGVILDLSHEIDYVKYLLGNITDIKGNFAKAGDVTLDTEDFADLLVKTKDCRTNIHINFLSHIPQRYIQLEFGSFTIFGDIINSEILIYQNGKLKQRHKLDYYQGQDYEDQLKYFFKNLDNLSMMNNLVEASGLFKKIIAFKKNA